MPLVCRTNAEVAAFCSAGLLALAAAANVLCWMRGVLNCLNELRRALLACLEAIVREARIGDVCELWECDVFVRLI